MNDELMKMKYDFGERQLHAQTSYNLQSNELNVNEC